MLDPPFLSISGVLKRIVLATHRQPPSAAGERVAAGRSRARTLHVHLQVRDIGTCIDLDAQAMQDRAE